MSSYFIPFHPIQSIQTCPKVGKIEKIWKVEARFSTSFAKLNRSASVAYIFYSPA